MKILTYNLLSGGQQGKRQNLSQITEALREISADFIALQEANNFELDNRRLLKKLADELEYPYYDLSRGGEKGRWGFFNAASLSKFPFKDINRFEGEFRNAALQTIIGSRIGDISICNTHLTPMTEDERLVEVEKVLKASSQYEKSIILGDINSLSPQDIYDADIITSFNPVQIEKFTKQNKLRFDVINKILEKGLTDVAVEREINKTSTVPTNIGNIDKAHATPMRLDYIFISKPLLSHLREVEVVITDMTETASDHYPILVEINM